MSDNKLSVVRPSDRVVRREKKLRWLAARPNVMWSRRLNRRVSDSYEMGFFNLARESGLKCRGAAFSKTEMINILRLLNLYLASREDSRQWAFSDEGISIFYQVLVKRGIIRPATQLH